jgi:hypothetical protein
MNFKEIVVNESDPACIEWFEFLPPPSSEITRPACHAFIMPVMITGREHPRDARPFKFFGQSLYRT